MDEFALLDATAQADLVRRRQVKPIELVESAIARIERLNPTLNAVVNPLFDLGRRTAAAPLPDGPFAGVPFLLKDFAAEHAGVPLTEGMAFLAGHYVAAEDSELVVRQKRAGLVILGQTNTPELGLMFSTEPRIFGACRNPWNVGHTTGGSSGGAAAAVASGMVAMAHANDAGGSIRHPASCCGVFGLKPTRARNPLGPHYGDLFGGLVVEHAITRSVRDSAALLDATAGPDLGDPYWAPPPARPFIEEAGADPGRLRIAFTDQAPTGVPVHSDCVRAVRDAAALCEQLGHTVVEAAPPLDGRLLESAYISVASSGFLWAVEDWARRTGRTPREQDFEPATWAYLERARRHSAAEYLLAMQDLQRIARQVARFLTDYDLWLTPTLAAPPALIGSFEQSPASPLRGLARGWAMMPFTWLFNATGGPAMSVPLNWNDDGLPIGVQFAGRFGDEATLFRLAAQLEAVRPWAGRRPPVHA